MKQYLVILLIAFAAASCLYEKGGVAPDSGNTGNTDNTNPTNSSATTICNLVAGSSSTTGEICFSSQILPIFISNCGMSGCHDSKSKRDGYELTSYDTILKKGIVKGDAAKSKIYRVLLENGEDRMPPAQPLSADKIKLIADWINQGAKNTTCQTATGTLADTVKISYSKHLKPILEYNCTGCHSSSNASGNIKLDTYAVVKTAADNGKLYGSIAHLSGYSPMPTGSKLSDCEIKAFKLWIDQGKQNN